MLVVGGESLIDLVPVENGPAGEPRLSAHAGGSPYNCAIAIARLGGRSGFLCPISRDSFGDMIRAPLDEAGVVTLMADRVGAPTSLAVVSLDQAGKARYEFYRSADRAFTPEALIAGLPETTELFQIGGFCPILADDARVWLSVADTALARGAILSIDPNVRPSLVDDFAAYVHRLDQFFDKVHIVKLSDDDLAALDPQKLVEDHAADLLARPNCEMVVVTLGDRGSRAFTRKATARAEPYMPPVFADTVGAGDTLMAGILAWLAEANRLTPLGLADMSEPDLAAMLRFGAVAAGLNCAHAGCHPPARGEVDAILSGS